MCSHFKIDHSLIPDLTGLGKAFQLSLFETPSRKRLRLYRSSILSPINSFSMPPGDGKAASESALDNVPVAPPDPILGLNIEFRADPSPTKVNLGVGAYRTDEGLPYVLPVVRRVEQKIVSDPSMNHEYLPQDGLSEFSALSARLILGNDSAVLAEGRSITVQTLSGTSALRTGFTFLQQHAGGHRPIYLPNPSWSNHRGIVNAVGMPAPKLYRYFSAVTGGADIDGMLEDLTAAPCGSIILLHTCAHNPTGADPSVDEWKAILKVVKERSHIPFFDTAYQGFASGDLDRDAFAVRLFADANVEMFIGQSYSKNLGLYGQRIGALTVTCRTTAPIAAIKSQLKLIIRATYSSPPLHGARIAAAVMSDANLFEEWKRELKIMSDRLSQMRQSLFQALVDNGTPGSWTHITSQIGMFSFTRLTKEQVLFMREKHHIYLTLNGRMSMAGLTAETVQYVADAMRDAVLNC